MSGNKENYKVTDVSLDKTSLDLEVGDSATLTATVQPSNADNQNVTWSSSDEAVATVANGVVTAVGAGTATITVTTEDGDFTAICAVTDCPPCRPPRAARSKGRFICPVRLLWSTRSWARFCSEPTGNRATF